MQLPPLQPLENLQYYVSGNVTIDPSAAIAPGVLLIADANSHIIIAARVCIGMGSIIDARNGTLEIEAGALLGTGVLVVGKGKIGAKACIGSAATIFNTSIAPRQAVPPGSIIGDSSRPLKEKPIPEVPTDSASVSQPNKTTLPTIVILPLAEKRQSVESSTPNTSAATLDPKDPTPEASASQTDTEVASTATLADSQETVRIQFAYGQAHLNRLLVTLFPQNQSLKPPRQDGKTD
ncbi:transferase [Planktothrix sp. FACHB-1355]|uniref:Transferase n=1 Tax=Aerosakkonema funiforme FACHB-1375 TaxID=2949571 RepID=A0A926VG40_9CYAN|nr:MULTISPECIES: transferase [Oscillatoriales]MBD2183088.1 transferase [Aerosakkonema funiforme FACHB-1375]MBD3559542.1 transferase [Planktothrix sp. FACHB-1355]